MNSKTKIPILLIEDNPGDVQLIKLHLKNASVRHILHHADTFYEGVDLAQQHEVQLVLLDLSLPDSSGFKTLTNFLEKVSNIPVIVLTGTNNEIVGNQAIKAGAQDFLVKGQFDGKLLGRSIRYALQRYSSQLKLQNTASRLSVNEKRYIEAQEMAHFGNWEMDIVNNEMKWTDEVYRIFSLQPNSFQPTLSEYLNYVHVEDRPQVEAFFEDAAKDGKLHQLEHKIIIAGHNIKHVALRAKVHFEETSGKILLVGVIQDISERKLNEQLILEKNLSNRTSKVMQQALSDMSFHVRTPLSSIVNLLFLFDKTQLSGSQVELMDGLKTSVDDMSMVLNNLLNFAVLATEDIKVAEDEFKIKDFLTSNEKILKIKSDTAKLDLTFESDEHLPEKIKVDAQKLTIIFYNIINYAITKTTDDSSISVRTSLLQQTDNTGNLTINLIGTNLDLIATQINELQQAEKLLEVYEPKGDPENSTINIAVAMRIAKLLGGTIQIKDLDDNRVGFGIKLPVKLVRQFKVAHGNKPNMPLRILLVEDHFLNQIATKKVLKTWSDLVTVDIAENGLIAVEKFREHGYDLILMDIQMPVMNGLEAAEKIREKSNVPIIALTANATKHEQDRCFETGMNEYLAKPFQPDDLYDRIMGLMALIAVGG